MTYKNIIIGIVVVILGAISFAVWQRTNIPPMREMPQGKLDINAVCDGALAYMTFADSVSADAFVAECKEGKHPEVIEHFKARMNLGDGAAI